MASKHQLDGRKNEDRAIALLSLGADRPGEVSSCPSDGDIAALVDGGCKEPERRVILQHLSVCVDCYRQWLALSQAVDRGKKKGQLLRLRRWRRAGYFGTALAVAASVAVFINTYRQIDMVSPPGDNQQIVLQDSQEVAPPQAQLPSLPPAPATLSAPEPEAVAESPREKAEVDHLAAKRQIVRPPESRPPIAEEMAAGMSGKVGERSRSAVQGKVASPAQAPSPPVRSEVAQEKERDQIRLWLDDVRDGCQSFRLDSEFWIALHLRGAELPPGESSRVDGFDRRIAVAAILPLVASLAEPGLDAVRLSDHCRQVLDEFGQETTNR